MKNCCELYLNEQFGGDAAVVGEIYREYVSSVWEKLAEVDAALGGDWQALDRAAHTIKGNALSAGDGEMAQVAIDLRGAAELRDVARAAELATKLRELAALL